MPRTIALRVKRPGHTERWHEGVLNDSDVLLTPEACNIDQRRRHMEQFDRVPDDVPLTRLCKRCYARRHLEAISALG